MSQESWGEDFNEEAADTLIGTDNPRYDNLSYFTHLQIALAGNMVHGEVPEEELAEFFPEEDEKRFRLILQDLEDVGLLELRREDDEDFYSVTEEGKAYLEEEGLTMYASHLSELYQDAVDEMGI